MAGPHTWTGGTSGVFNLAANWDTAAVPASSEIAIFNGSSTVACTDGSGVSAVDLAELRIESTYAQDIGGSTPLTISAGKVVHRGSGTLTYIDGDGTTDRIEVDSENSTDALDLSGTTTTKLVVTKGKAHITGGTVTTAVVDARTNRTTDAELEIDSGATVTNIFVNGGVCEDNSQNNSTLVSVGCVGTYTCSPDGARTITSFRNYGATATLSPAQGATLTCTAAEHYGGTTTHSGNGDVTYTDSDAYTPSTVTLAQDTVLTNPMLLHGRPTIRGATGKTVQFA